MRLVTLEDARDHLRIDDHDQDGFLLVQLTNAESAVVDYLKSRADDTWTTETVPGHVRASVLLALAVLWENREGDVDPITPAVESLLRRSRDPALA